MLNVALVALCAAVAAQEPPPPGHALALGRTRQQGICVTDFGRTAPTEEITIEFWQRVDAQANQCVLLLDSGASNNCIGVFGPSRVGSVHWHFGDAQGDGSLH